MKLLITEKQLKKLVSTITDEELEEDLDEQDMTDAAAGDSTPKSGASDYQSGGEGYPEVHKWESGVSRGPDNQVGNTKWSDVVGSKISRERYPLN